jgi:putative NIF3 family GTP cyclohydrolase 1 type 2
VSVWPWAASGPRGAWRDRSPYSSGDAPGSPERPLGGSRLALLTDVMDALGELFPWELAGDRDGSGLLVGSRGSWISRVMCSIECSGDRVQAALDSGCELLVAHHPHLLRAGASTVDLDSPAGALAGRALAGGLNVVACHTNADAAAGGAADLMAEHLGLVGAGPLQRSTGVYMAKVVVFVPPEALEAVSAAMAGAGAGIIGQYEHCGFRVEGEGTFVPGPGAHPYSGEAGALNVKSEARLEMTVPSYRVAAVLEAAREEHPYEEVACDVYRTEAPVPWGVGRLGRLPEARKLGQITEDLALWCGSPDPRLTGDPGKPACRIGVVPGYAGDRVGLARAAGADLLVTGEIDWHRAVEASDSGLAVIALGHLQSERPLVERMVDGLLEVSGRRGLGLAVEGYRDQEGRWG